MKGEPAIDTAMRGEDLANQDSKPGLKRRSLAKYTLNGGMLLVSGCAVANGGQSPILKIPGNNLRNVAWSLDGTRVVASNNLRTYTGVWNAADGQKLWQHELGGRYGGGAVGFVDDSSLVVTSGLDGGRQVTCLLSAASGEEKEFLGGLANPLTVSADQTTLALQFGERDSVQVRRFGGKATSLRIGPLVDAFGRTGRPVQFLALNSDGTRLALGSILGEIQIWDVETNTCVGKLISYPRSDLSSLAFAGLDILVTASNSDHMVVYDREHTRGYNWPIAPAPRSSASVGVWNTTQMSFVRWCDTNDGDGTVSAAGSQDSQYVAALARTGSIYVWSINDGALLESAKLPDLSTIDGLGDITFDLAADRIAAGAGSSIYLLSLTKVRRS